VGFSGRVFHHGKGGSIRGGKKNKGKNRLRKEFCLREPEEGQRKSRLGRGGKRGKRKAKDGRDIHF